MSESLSALAGDDQRLGRLFTILGIGGLVASLMAGILGIVVVVTLTRSADQSLAVTVAAVETADEMLAAVLDFLPEADAVICAAAVCDYRPAARSEGKLKRSGPRTVELVENPDIAAEVGERREGRPFAVFAVETEDAVGHALEKLERKGADWCVLNSPDAFGEESARFTLLGRDGSARELGEIPKEALAIVLLESMGL